MLLSSASEPTGPKSTNHYLVVHHGDQHDLLALPETYSELEEHVKRTHHIDRGQFYVETDDLNLCRGIRINIPQDAWTDIARLIGNVFIVPRRANLADKNPETNPEGEQSSQTTPLETQTRGEIALNEPFADNSVLRIKVAHIDAEAHTEPSTQSEIQLLDRNRKSALTIGIFPHSRWISFKTPNGEASFSRTLREAFPFQSAHEIVIHKEDRRYHILCDRQFIGTVEGPPYFFLTTVTYEFETQSPFKGPVSATTYSNMFKLFKESPLYRSVLPVVDLYRMIIACNAQDKGDILQILAEVRNGEILSPNPVNSGIKHQKHAAGKKQWIDLIWNIHAKSMFVVRITCPPQGAATTSYIVFGPSPHYSLQITINANDIQVGEYSNTGQFAVHGTFVPLQPPLSPGEHTIAFINQKDGMYVISDFSKSFIFPNSTIMTRKPSQIHFNVPLDRVLDVDIYDFGQ